MLLIYFLQTLCFLFFSYDFSVFMHFVFVSLFYADITLVNVYVASPVLMHIAGTS